MASLAQSIVKMIQDALPAPNIKRGIVADVRLAETDLETDEVLSLGRVTVSGLAEDDLACDLSSGFDLEVSAQGVALIGREVEVHFIDKQPVIAYSIVQGDKP